MLHIRIITEISVLSAINSCQAAIVVALNSIVRSISGKSKSQRITGQLIIWIDSQVIFFKPYTLDIVFLLNFFPGHFRIIWYAAVILECFLIIHGDLLFHDLILTLPGLIRSKPGTEFSFIKAKYGNQSIHRRIQIILI